MPPRTLVPRVACCHTHTPCHRTCPRPRTRPLTLSRFLHRCSSPGPDPSAFATPTSSPTHVMHGSLESWRAPHDVQDDATKIVVECREVMWRLWSDRCTPVLCLCVFAGVAHAVHAQRRA